MLFSGWDSLLRTLVVGVLAYVVLVVLLRVSGKRTLSKMNAFDLVVTVALGSTLATALLARDVALAEGVLPFALLIGLQIAVTWSSVLARHGPPRVLLRGERHPSACGAAPEETQDGEQYYRADQRHDEAHDSDAVVDGAGAEQWPDQPSADQCADDADHDVEDDALLGVGAHEHACDPADQAAHDEPYDDAHDSCLQTISTHRAPVH